MAINTQSIRDRLARLEHDLAAIDQRRARMVIERDVLRDLLKDGGEPEKLGPADAVRRIVEEQPGIKRAELVKRAVEIVATKPEKNPKATIKQTIRNLAAKPTPGIGIRIEGDQVYPVSANGDRKSVV